MNDWEKKPLLRPSEEGQSPIRLSILGDFVLSNAKGRQFPIATKKNRALLAVLALSPGFQATRERLCGLLWGDRGEDQARSSLRQSLAVLRKELGQIEEFVLKTHDDIVALRSDTTQMDAVELLALSNNSEINTLRQAAKLYRGELLGDTSIRDAAFEDWLSAERSRLRTVAIKIFDRLVPLEEGHSRIAAAQQLISFDPLRESSHRLLMQAYADQGDNGLALKQFDLCRKLLHEELGVELSEGTLELRRKILGGDRKSAKPGGAWAEPSQVTRAERLPSVAVLLFVNLSGDPQKDDFAIGVSENLILALSRFQEIRVLQADASYGSSTLQKPSDGNSLAKQADFVLGGSIRKNGDRIRITVQLRSAHLNQVCWTDQYDRHTHDIFAIQDEIVEACAYSIVNKINTEMLQALQSGRTENFSAYELFIQGRSNAYKLNEESTLLAAQLLQNAIQLDSHFAAAHAWLAETIWVAWWAGWRDDKNTALSAALNHARRAVEFDNGDPHGFAELGQAYLYQGEFSLAQGAIERSLFLNPNNPDAMIIYSFYWLYMGDAEKAHDVIQSAIRRDPNGHYGVVLGIILYILGRWGESVAALRHVRAKFHSVDAWLAAALAMNGDQIAARAATNRYLANRPPSGYVGEAANFILERNPFKAQKDIELVRDGLTKAGL